MIAAKQLLVQSNVFVVNADLNLSVLAVLPRQLNVNSTGVRTIFLPNPAGNPYSFVITSNQGDCWFNPITLSRNGLGFNINGSPVDLVLRCTQGSWQVTSDGTDVTVVGPLWTYGAATVALKGVVSNDGPSDLGSARSYTPTVEAGLLATMNSGWWYDYNAETVVTAPLGMLYYPMIYNRSVLPSIPTAAATYGRLLGYNEPDSNGISAAQAATDWPSFRATGAYCVSPACAGLMNSNTAGNWFHDFMVAISSDVDAIAVHNYQDPAQTPATAAAAHAAYIDSIHTLWNKPIIVTETGGIKFVGGPATWVFGTDSWTTAYINALMPLAKVRSYWKGLSFYPLNYTADVLAISPTATGIMLANADASLRTQGAAFAAFL